MFEACRVLTTSYKPSVIRLQHARTCRCNRAGKTAMTRATRPLIFFAISFIRDKLLCSEGDLTQILLLFFSTIISISSARLHSILVSAFIHRGCIPGTSPRSLKLEDRRYSGEFQQHCRNVLLLPSHSTYQLPMPTTFERSSVSLVQNADIYRVHLVSGPANNLCTSFAPTFTFRP